MKPCIVKDPSLLLNIRHPAGLPPPQWLDLGHIYPGELPSHALRSLLMAALVTSLPALKHEASQKELWTLTFTTSLFL